MISGIVTAILLAAFLGGTAWAYSGRRRAEFEAAARVPLEDLPSPANAAYDAVSAEATLAEASLAETTLAEARLAEVALAASVHAERRP